jgi:hypothetical protein
MKVNDLLRYSYNAIKANNFCHTFGRPQKLKDEGSILRIADLNVINKSSIDKIVLDSCENGSASENMKSEHIVLIMKNGENIELDVIKEI